MFRTPEVVSVMDLALDIIDRILDIDEGMITERGIVCKAQTCAGELRMGKGNTTVSPCAAYCAAKDRDFSL